jgi:Ca2+-binding RTX toxin-like protein
VGENFNDALGGVDTVFSSVSYSLSPGTVSGGQGFGIENLTLTGVGNINATGNGNNNVLTGNSGNNSLSGGLGNDTLNGGNGNDTLDGGLGADKMNGGDGSDTYFVDNIGDVVGENFNDALGGVDTVFSSVSYSLSPGTVSGGQGFGIENLTLTGVGNINATGNGNNNVLTGNSGNNSLSGGLGNDTLNGGNGNDTLDGGLGADSMNGGDGSDTYFVDNIGDVVGENFNDALGGVDTVFSSVNHTLGFGIENLTLTGVGNINGTGNGNNNVITGNSGNNTLSGLAGNDTLNGGNGNDTLDGGLGADSMNGGDGSDTYSVDNVGDVVAETFNDALGGVDTVFSSVNHTLGFGIENLTLTGVGNINATGNGNNNVITGNSGNNTLSGLAGNDTLNGGNGNDTLDGGLGADSMNGGDGSDTYTVDNVGDVVAETFNDALGGVDSVFSSVNHTLGFGIENLTLTGFANINATGNGNNNVITGNSGNNSLDGGLGADSMNGGDGSDTYTVDNVGDVVAETFNDALGGVDSVFSSVNHTLGFGIENLTLTGFANINGTGNGNNNLITGNSGNNSLSGLAGNDTLIGGGGNDSLTGGSGADTLWGNQGADTFIFNQLSEGIDIIKDFQWTESDTIQISAFGFGASSLSQFSYDSSTGALFFDPIGLTGPTQFATIENKPAGFSTNLDIVIV